MTEPAAPSQKVAPSEAPPRPAEVLPSTRQRQSAVWDGVLNGLALTAAGLALLVTGALTLPNALTGRRLLSLTTESESSMQGQLTRIERTLRRIARGDSLSRHERFVWYPSPLNLALAEANKAFGLESLGQVDAAVRQSEKAARLYDSILGQLDDTSEVWALGTQLRDLTLHNVNRLNQRAAASRAFRVQIVVAGVTLVIGFVLTVLGLLAIVAARTSPKEATTSRGVRPDVQLRADPGAGSTSPDWSSRLALLSLLVQWRSSHDATLWTMFSAFWATNALLLVALFNNGWPLDGQVVWVVGPVGMLAALIWTAIQYKSLRTIAAIEKAIRECQEGSPPPFIGHWPRFSKPKNLARHMMYVSSAGSFLGWLAAILLL